MSSEVDIYNLALSHLGDTAAVASPTEQSVQAEHCRRFYPLSRDTLLEKHNWNFSTKRVALALLAATSGSWAYAYAVPADMLAPIAVLPPDTPDYMALAPYPTGYYSPQPFQIELMADGTKAILTDQEGAILRYSAAITDTSRFSPTFVLALSHLLAAMLAGPILKGDVGAKEAKTQLSLVEHLVSQAILADANARDIRVEHTAPWIAAR